MSHTVTGKLNKDARQHPSEKGVTFFVSLGEQNYNFRTKQKEWTNYEAAIFASANQVQFYTDVLKSGSIISVSGSGLLIEMDTTGQYPPKLAIQDAKLAYSHTPAVPMPQAVQQQVNQMAPQQAPQQYQQAPQMQQAPMQQNAQGYANAAPQQGFANAPDFPDDIPF